MQTETWAGVIGSILLVVFLIIYRIKVKNFFKKQIQEDIKHKNQKILSESQESDAASMLETMYKAVKDTLPRKIEEQIIQVRKFLNVATLTVFRKRDMAVNFRSDTGELSEANIIKANIMVQLAINIALKTDAPKFNRALFEEAVLYALTLTKEHGTFYPLIKEAFRKAGVIFVILPNISGSRINGAAKIVGNRIMLLVNDRRLYSDTFWFTLFHEIGHIMNGDYGISFESERGEQEEIADKYAEDMLIPNEQYQQFVEEGRFDMQAIKEFALSINRDPGIVLGRLLNDKKVSYEDRALAALRHKYKVKIA